MGRELKKKLTVLDVFCIATGAMISSGLFILPGLAFAKAGPAVIISYIIAGLFCIPTLFSMAELTTAMPKAGGDYFYIMRGFGPLLGTVAGFSTWFSLSLKGAFALIGMGAYLSIITPIPISIIALICCIFFVGLNLVGVKEAGRFQVFLVLGLLGILLIYIFWGSRSVDPQHFTPFFSKGFGSVFATASFVFISYGGLTKVAAIAEETKNPGRNLPLGMFLSLIVTAIFYTLVIYTTTGILNPELLSGSLTPISDCAGVFGGNSLKIVISIGAFLAFISTANSGIMTASRYPLGMSRDKLLPASFQKLSSKFQSPYVSIICTGIFMVTVILFLRLELLVKVASSILLLLYIFANFTLILFRESKILSYKPKFHSPFYPYMQILGILGGLFLLIEMGTYIVLRQQTVQASHILLAYEGSERGTATRTKEEALELIKSLQDSISAGSLTFSEAAMNHSDCPSSNGGGDLGHFPRNMMDPAFEEAAFSLEPGDISDIVETPFGYHVIMRTE